MERRLTPANDRVAASFLKGTVNADRYSDGELRQVIRAPFLHASPGGKRERQLLWGDAFQVYDVQDNWAFGQSLKDGYVGYLPDKLTQTQDHTHRVAVRSTWAYAAPDFKEPPLEVLFLNSKVNVLSSDDRWTQIEVAENAVLDIQSAFIPSAHLTAIEVHASDPVAVAEIFLGTPYVWAGNSGFGIDCSGLVQAALLACGMPCPGDSDMQEALGVEIAADEPLRRGDLLFWKGHVAFVFDDTRILHANAFHMSVALENTEDAIKRIATQGDGPVTNRRRL